MENFPEKVAFEFNLKEIEVYELNKLAKWVSGLKKEYCKGMRRHGVFGK